MCTSDATDIVIDLKEALVRPLLRLISSDGSADTDGHVVACIALLADIDISADDFVAEGAVPMLVNVLRDGTSQEKKQSELALSNLTNSISAFEDLPSMVDILAKEGAGSALGQLIDILENGSLSAQRATLSFISNLSEWDFKARGVLIGAGAMSPVVRMVQNGEFRAVYALYWLSLDHDANKKKFAAAGAVGLLARLLQTGSSVKLMGVAAGALSNFSMNPSNQTVMMGERVLEGLVKLLIDGTPFGQEHAIKTLYDLAVDPAIKVGSIFDVLKYLLMTWCYIY